MFDVGVVGYPTITTTKSFDLDGVDEYLTVGNVLDKTGTSAFSISAWVKTDTLTGGQVIMSKRNGDSTAGYLYYLTASGIARLYIESTGGGALFCANNSGISTGTCVS